MQMPTLKKKYKSINLKLSKEILDEFDSLCQTENCSRPEMLKKNVRFLQKIACIL